MKDFNDYFAYQEDYPTIITDNLLPYSTLYCYVSSTFLNGWINYIDIKKAYLISRYNEEKNHKELADKFNKHERFHMDLGKLKDDILILGQPRKSRKWGAEENTENRYWFFWFDCDVSDCQIGRFITDDPLDTVKEIFASYCQLFSKELSKDYLGEEIPAFELDPKAFSRWMEF